MAAIVNARPGRTATSGGLITRSNPSLAALATNQVASTVTTVAAKVGSTAFRVGKGLPNMAIEADHCAEEDVSPQRCPGGVDHHAEAKRW